jgi:hypothetical protein
VAITVGGASSRPLAGHFFFADRVHEILASVLVREPHDRHVALTSG